LGFELIVSDLRELSVEELAPRLTDVGTIVHLVGILEGSRKLLLEVNYHGTAKLLTAARAAGVTKIIHLSSMGATANPQFPYAYSAWLAEQAVQRSGLQFIIFRPPVLIGPSAPFTTGLIRMARNWPFILLPKSKTKFQPLSVGDLVHCILQMLEAQGLPDRIVELGGPEIVTLKHLVQMIQADLGTRKPMVYLPRRPLRLSIRILRQLGLDPPLVASHLIGTDMVAGPGAVEAACNFAPRPLDQALDLQAEAEASIIRQ